MNQILSIPSSTGAPTSRRARDAVAHEPGRPVHVTLVPQITAIPAVPTTNASNAPWPTASIGIRWRAALLVGEVVGRRWGLWPAAIVVIPVRHVLVTVVAWMSKTKLKSQDTTLPYNLDTLS